MRDQTTNLIVDVARSRQTAEILIDVDMLKYFSNQARLRIL